MQQLLLSTTTGNTPQYAEESIPNRALLYYADLGVVKIKYNDIMIGIVAYPDNKNITFDSYRDIALSDNVQIKKARVTPDEQVPFLIEKNESIALNGRYILLLKRNMNTDSCISGSLCRVGPLVRSCVEFSAMANGSISLGGSTTESKKPTAAIVSYNGIEYTAIAFSDAYSCNIYFSGFDGRTPETMPPKIGSYTDKDIHLLRTMG